MFGGFGDHGGRRPSRYGSSGSGGLSTSRLESRYGSGSGSDRPSRNSDGRPSASSPGPGSLGVPPTSRGYPGGHAAWMEDAREAIRLTGDPGGDLYPTRLGRRMAGGPHSRSGYGGDPYDAISGGGRPGLGGDHLGSSSGGGGRVGLGGDRQYGSRLDVLSSRSGEGRSGLGDHGIRDAMNGHGPRSGLGGGRHGSGSAGHRYGSDAGGHRYDSGGDHYGPTAVGHRGPHQLSSFDAGDYAGDYEDDEYDIWEEGDFGGGALFDGPGSDHGTEGGHRNGLGSRGAISGQRSFEDFFDYSTSSFAGSRAGGQSGFAGAPLDYGDYDLDEDQIYTMSGGHYLNDEYLDMAVFNDQDMDNTISHLMDHGDNAPIGPPPASDAAIAALKKKKANKRLLGDKDKADCTICMDEVKVGDEVAVLPCDHWFHSQCITVWLKEHDTCPHCRKAITPGSNRRR